MGKIRRKQVKIASLDESKIVIILGSVENTDFLEKVIHPISEKDFINLYESVKKTLDLEIYLCEFCLRRHFQRQDFCLDCVNCKLKSESNVIPKLEDVPLDKIVLIKRKKTGGQKAILFLPIKNGNGTGEFPSIF